MPAIVPLILAGIDAASRIWTAISEAITASKADLTPEDLQKIVNAQTAARNRLDRLVDEARLRLAKEEAEDEHDA